MIQDVLRAMGGVGMYGVISICIFFVVFTATFIWTLRLKRPYLNSMRELPLEEPEPPFTGESSHER